MPAPLTRSPVRRSAQVFTRFQAIKSSPFVTRSKEKLDDMRERWETSDSRMVQGIQNMHESFSRESETAVAMKEIRCAPNAGTSKAPQKAGRIGS